MNKLIHTKLHNQYYNEFENKLTTLGYIEWLEEKLEKERTINNLSNLKNKYKNRPDKLAEEIFGVKLLPYQKIMLMAMSKVT